MTDPNTQAETGKADPPPPLLPADFSLVLGGPLFQLLMKTGLVEPSMRLLPRRVFFFILITWFPLAVLAAIAGTFFGGVDVPFLHSSATHGKLLVALPLLIGAEVIVHRRIRAVLEQFLERGIVGDADRARFDQIVARAMRLRNSALIEVILLVVAWSVGYQASRTQMEANLTTWGGIMREDGALHLSAGGTWAFWVALPIFRFILLRWYFRIGLWYMMAFQISRLDLHLNPLHPDRAAGLGFLAASADAMAPILVAHTSFLSVYILGKIWWAGAKLPQFKLEIGAFGLCLLLLVLVPLTFFAPHLARARREGMRRAGLLAERYSDDFRSKWMGDTIPGDQLLGTGDIQSMADLGNAYAVVRETGFLPFGKGMVVRLVIFMALPLVPLGLTMMPLEALLERLVAVVV